MAPVKPQTGEAFNNLFHRPLLRSEWLTGQQMFAVAPEQLRARQLEAVGEGDIDMVGVCVFLPGRFWEG